MVNYQRQLSEKEEKAIPAEFWGVGKTFEKKVDFFFFNSIAIQSGFGIGYKFLFFYGKVVLLIEWAWIIVLNDLTVHLAEKYCRFLSQRLNPKGLGSRQVAQRPNFQFLILRNYYFLINFKRSNQRKQADLREWPLF